MLDFILDTKILFLADFITPTVLALTAVATSAAGTAVTLAQDTDAPDAPQPQEEEPEALSDAEKRRLARQRQSLNRQRRGAADLRIGDSGGGNTNQATAGIQIPSA